MKEILPGVFHWLVLHEKIELKVSSYYLVDAEGGMLVDPMVPEEGLEWFGEEGPPRHILLTNRHHYRHSGQFREAFGTTIWCHRAGLHEFTKGEEVKAFEHGQELPGGIMALEVGSLCPEETALFIPRSGGTLAFGDGLIRDPETGLDFVPDQYMGDDPEGVKAGLKTAFKGLLDREFDHLLFAHGLPVVTGGKEALRRFAEAG